MITTNDTPTASTPLLLHAAQNPSHGSKVYIQRYRSGKRRYPLFLFRLVIAPMVLITLVTLLAWDTSPLGHCYMKPICRALKDGNEMEEIWWRNQGPYAPYKEFDHSKNLEYLPRGCEIDQVTLVSSLSRPYGRRILLKGSVSCYSFIGTPQDTLPPMQGDVCLGL